MNLSSMKAAAMAAGAELFSGSALHKNIWTFTEDNLAAFVSRIRADAMEEAAVLCDGMVYAYDHGGNEYRRPAHAEHCAAAIRSAASNPKPAG